MLNAVEEPWPERSWGEDETSPKQTLRTNTKYGANYEHPSHVGVFPPPAPPPVKPAAVEGIGVTAGVTSATVVASLSLAALSPCGAAGRLPMTLLSYYPDDKKVVMATSKITGGRGGREDQKGREDWEAELRSKVSAYMYTKTLDINTDVRIRSPRTTVVACTKRLKSL